jgi:hypothetical protein
MDKSFYQKFMGGDLAEKRLVKITAIEAGWILNGEDNGKEFLKTLSKSENMKLFKT